MRPTIPTSTIGWKGRDNDWAKAAAASCGDSGDMLEIFILIVAPPWDEEVEDEVEADMLDEEEDKSDEVDVKANEEDEVGDILWSPEVDVIPDEVEDIFTSLVLSFFLI